VVITGGGTGLTYQPDADYCNGGSPTDDFTYTVNGNDTATVSVTVSCVDDNPVVDTSPGATSYTENDPPTPVDPAVTVTDADAGGQLAGATVTITGNFAAGQDVLALGGSHAPITATFSGATLTLSGAASPAAYQAALRDVTYVNGSDGPSTLPRTITFTVTDDTALTGSDTKGLSVTAVNDPPTAVDDSGHTDEDTPLVVAAPGVLGNDIDPDPGDTKSVTGLNGTATLTQTLASGASVAIHADGSYTYDPLAAFQHLSTGQTATDTFTYTMADGGGATSTATVTVTIDGISDPPLATNDSFAAVGNTGLFVGTTRPAGQAGLEVTGSVLDNDTDPDTPPASLSVTAETKATSGGGSVTINGNGSFSVQPDDGDTTDSFTYTVSDGVASSVGTVTISMNGDQVWYVKNNQAAGGDGTSDTPFDTLAEAEAASGSGDTVYVFDGDNTSANLDTGYVMDSGERLVGEARSLSADPDGAGSAPSTTIFPGTPGAQPTLSATDEDVVVLAAGASVDGFVLDPSGTGGGVFGGASASNVTVTNLDVVDTGTAGTQPGIELDGSTGTNVFSNVTVTNGGGSGAIGVRLNNAGTVRFNNAGTNTISTTGAKALDVAGTDLSTSRWNQVSVTGSGSGAIRLSNTTGTPTLGDGVGNDLVLQTTSGATAAFEATNAAGVTVDAGGTDTVSATGGPAVDISSSSGSTYSFDSVTSTNSAGDGINLDSNGATTFSSGSGSAISGAAGIGLDVNQGTGNVTYNGTISTTAAGSRPVEVTGRSGGTVDLSGTVNGTGQGVNLTGNTGATVRFAGGLTLTTGANPAFTATGGGTVVVTDPNGAGTAPDNILTTTTGTALNVANTTIGSGGLSFRSISANGATNGVVLNNTGSSAGLTISGTGGSCTSAGSCTGGAILNTTSALSLTSTRDVSVDRLFIQNTVGDGVDGTGTTNFSFTNGYIDSSGTGHGVETSNIGFNTTAAGTENNLSGAVTITGNTLTNAYYHGIDIFNFSGTISNATISNNTITSSTSTAASKGGGIRLVGFGSAGAVANITTATLNQNTISNFPSGSGIQVQGGNANLGGPAGSYGSAGSPITLTNNTVSGQDAANRMATFALAAVVNGRGTGFFDITGNTLSNTIGTTLAISSFGFATTTATVANNIIVAHNGLGSSGIGAGTSQVLAAGETPTLNIAVTGNTVSQTDGVGILLTARDAAGHLNAGVRNNNVAAPLSGNRDGIRVDAGNSISTDDAVCLDISGNTSAGTGLSPEGIGLRKQGTVGTTNDFGIEGMAATASPGVESFVNGQNPAANGTLLISATSGFSGCNTAP
jgi:VCBS repeat-containing protein